MSGRVHLPSEIFWRIFRDFLKVFGSLWKINISSVKWGLPLGTFVIAHIGVQCMFYDKALKFEIILPLHGNLIQCERTKMF